jgi:hypothetical protein
VTAGPVTTELPFSARHYLDRLKALDVAPRGQKGLRRDQVEKLVNDLVVEVGRAQRVAGLERTRADAAREAHKYHADEKAAARQPYEHDGPPTMAIDAVVQGQLLAERTDRAANLEILHRLDAADRAQREAQALLDAANATAVTAPPTLTLPPEPKRTDDIAADLEALEQHFRACREALAAHSQALAEHDAEQQAAQERQRARLAELEDDLAEQERAVRERQGAFVDQLDRITDVAPAVRERVIDLTEASEPTGETERVA